MFLHRHSHFWMSSCLKVTRFVYRWVTLALKVFTLLFSVYSGYYILFYFFYSLHFGVLTLIILSIGKSLHNPIMHSWFNLVLVSLILFIKILHLFSVLWFVCFIVCSSYLFPFNIYLIVNTIY